MSCISAHDPQLARLADAIAQRVGQQRFHVWFNNSTRLDLKQDGLEIAVPNDFISEWIGTHFKAPIQEAAHEVLGCPLQVRFNVVPQLFEAKAHPIAAAEGQERRDDDDEVSDRGEGGAGVGQRRDADHAQHPALQLLDGAAGGGFLDARAASARR